MMQQTKCENMQHEEMRIVIKKKRPAFECRVGCAYLPGAFLENGKII